MRVAAVVVATLAAAVAVPVYFDIPPELGTLWGIVCGAVGVVVALD